MVKTAIWAAAGLVLSWAAIRNLDTLDSLTVEVQALRVGVVRLEETVKDLPPAALVLQIQHLEKRIEKLELIIGYEVNGPAR